MVYTRVRALMSVNLFRNSLLNIDSDSVALLIINPRDLLLPLQCLMAEVYYVGVDVGTASVRAALVTRAGLLQSTAEEPISIWEPQADHYVQSSAEIWEKCCSVVKVTVISKQCVVPALY